MYIVYTAIGYAVVNSFQELLDMVSLLESKNFSIEYIVLVVEEKGE